MQWPWQKREARRTDASLPEGDRPSAVAVAPAVPARAPAPAPTRRAWTALPPLVPVAAPRLATIAEVRPAAALATLRPTDLVHRFEPKARGGEGPSGSLLDAATVVAGFEPLRAADVDYVPVELPPLPVRRAPVVEIVIPPAPAEAPPEPELVAAPVVREPSAAPEAPEPVMVEPEPIALEIEIEPPSAPPMAKRNLGQSRRLGLGAPIVREPVEEPEPVPEDIRSEIRSAYGVDVGDVAVRRDRAASDEARLLAAAALARGGDEVILPADLGPADQPVTKGMLAHELTHIAQQRRHGPGLPSESSVEGLALEAAARAAEQRFRGDAGAPPLLAKGAPGPDQLFTTGLADVSEGGEIVFAPPPRPASGVQRIPLQATTPPYRWQQEYLQAEAYTTSELETEPGTEPSPADIEDAAAQLEQDNLPELVQYRETIRQQYVADEEETMSAARYGETVGPGPEADALDTEHRAVAEQRSALEQQLQHRTDSVELQNQAVDEVDAAMPLRDTGADPGATYVSVDSEPDVVRIRDALTRLDQTYPDLVHPAAGEPAPAFRARDLVREAFPGFRSMSLLGTAFAGPSTPTAAGPIGTTDFSTSGASATTRQAPSDFGTSAGTLPSESSGFSRDVGEQSAFNDWLVDGQSDFDQLAEDDERAQELRAWPMIRAERNHLLRLLIAEKIGELRSEAQAAGRPVPSEYQAMSSITRDEWQLIALTVEQQFPLEHLVDEQYQLLEDPENANLRELVALSPTAREFDEPVVAPVGMTTTTGSPIDEPVTPPGMTPTMESPFDEAMTTSDYGAIEAYGSTDLEAAPAASPEPAGEGGPWRTRAAGLGAAGAVDEFDDDDDVELSDELLSRLATQLYPRFRSRLRTELLVDRERAGLLTDFR